MNKVSMTILINTDNHKLFLKAIKAVCWVFGDKDFLWRAPYSISVSIDDESDHFIF